MTILGYFRIARKEIVRKPARNTLACLALLLCSLELVILVAFSFAARQILVAQLGPSENLNLVTVTAAKTGSLLGIYGNVQVANQHNQILTNKIVGSLQKISGVSFADPLSVIYEFKNFQVEGTSKVFVAQAEGLSQPNSQSLPLSSGSEFNPNSTDHNVVIGEAYAKSLGYGTDQAKLLGKQISITTVDGYRGAGANIPGPITTVAQNNSYNNSATTLKATIVGVTGQGPQQNELFIPEAWAHQIRTQSYWQYDSTKAATVRDPQTAAYTDIGELKSTDQINEDGYSSIILGATSATAVPGVASAVAKLGLGVVSNAQLVTQLNTYTRILGLIIGAIAVITFVASSLGIVNTFLMLVNEQRYVIAIWRACGATRKQILFQYLFQAGLIGLIGGVFGTGLGYLLSRLAIERVVHILQGSSLIVSNLSIPPFYLIAGGILFTFVFSTLSGLIPAISAAYENVSETLSSGQ
jgi:ABC-type antimicrobial peptide transport system permease subunit